MLSSSLTSSCEIIQIVKTRSPILYFYSLFLRQAKTMTSYPSLWHHILFLNVMTCDWIESLYTFIVDIQTFVLFYYIILVMTHTKYFFRLLSLVIMIVSIWRWCTYQKARNKIYMASKNQINHRLKCRARSKLNHITQKEKLQK